MLICHHLLLNETRPLPELVCHVFSTYRDDETTTRKEPKIKITTTQEERETKTTEPPAKQGQKPDSSTPTPGTFYSVSNEYFTDYYYG